MAVALKVHYFLNASDLATFCANGANNVTTIVSITFDTSSSKFTLFFT